MSLEAVAWALRQNVGDPTAKLILISLADHHNASTGECFPSKARLAEAGCCDARTVKRKLAALVDEGWLFVKPRFAENGRQTSNAYVIDFQRRGAKTAENLGGQSDPLPPREGDNVPPSGVTELCPPHSLTGTGTKEAQARASEMQTPTRQAGAAGPKGEAEPSCVPPSEARPPTGYPPHASSLSPDDPITRAERVAELKRLAGNLRAGAAGHPPPRRIPRPATAEGGIQ